jgi:hypothetical protein
MGEPYINCLILNDKVLLPISGCQWDDEAIESYEAAMPGYEVLGFSGSWQSTDALHCRTKGIVDHHMLYIEHTPLSGSQYGNEGFNISAKIFPYSGENLITESTGVYWMIEGGSWNFEEMESLGDHEYFSIIPPQENGTIVYYYIHAEDDSGRIENHPYIGEAWAHFFSALIDNDPPEIIDLYGPTEGRVGEEYTFCVTAVDPDFDIIYVHWDWDDGTETDWLGPYGSGDEICENHSWDSKRGYKIEVRVKDVHGAEAKANLDIKIPRTKILQNNLFYNFLKNILNSFPIIKMLIHNILK